MALANQNKQRVLHYYNSIASQYEERVGRGPLQWLRSRERSAVSSLLELPSVVSTEPSFLDAGCGQGYYSRLARREGFVVTAIDASPGMIEAASGYAHHAEIADLENWNTRDRFDRIVCAGVLDFVSDPERCARRLTRLLKPDGKMVLLVPRRGFGGLIYRTEKRFQGIQVNLFDLNWVHRLTRETGMTLTGILYPLPTNMAIQLSYLRPRLV